MFTGYEKNGLINGVIWTIVCMAMVTIFVYSLVYSFVNSLRSVYSAPIFSMPSKPEWKNYVYAVTLIPFFRYMKSTLIITFIKIFFGVTVSFIYGYAFARLKARGKKIFVYCFVVTNDDSGNRHINSAIYNIFNNGIEKYVLDMDFKLSFYQWKACNHPE